MKKCNRFLPVLLALTMLVLMGAGQSVAATKEDTTTKNGAPTQQQTRMTQAQRQAAADRAKAKGFVLPELDPSAALSDTATEDSSSSKNPDKASPAKGGQ